MSGPKKMFAEYKWHIINHSILLNLTIIFLEKINITVIRGIRYRITIMIEYTKICI